MKKTRSPSLAGVDDARLLLAWVGTLCAGSVFVHTGLPVFASRACSVRCLPSADVDWRKTRPFTTIGDECPPGSGAAQRTFSIFDHEVGTAVSATPDPFGPRNRVQSAASSSGSRRANAR